MIELIYNITITPPHRCKHGTLPDAKSGQALLVKEGKFSIQNLFCNSNLELKYEHFSFSLRLPFILKYEIEKIERKDYNTISTPLSIDISPHGGESVGCKAECADEMQNELASTLAPLCKGSSRRVRGTKRKNNLI